MDKLLATIRQEQIALDHLGQHLGPHVNSVLHRLGAAVWGRSLLSKRYTVIGPGVKASGLEWTLREGKWQPEAASGADFLARPHEYFRLRISFDQMTRPTHVEIECAGGPIACPYLSVSAVELLAQQARRHGPVR